MEQTKKSHKDFYYILGVEHDATSQEIQNSYNDLYEKFGPHVAASTIDPEQQARTFREICDAYEVLMNPEARKEYDKTSHTIRQTSDIRALWGKIARDKENEAKKRARPTADMEQVQVQAQALLMDIEISLKEAVKGTRKQFIITDPTPCENCATKKPLERMQCDSCRGLGYFNVDRSVDVDLPPGVLDNTELRKTALGRWDLRAGKYGDLILKIKLREHPFLKVDGKDLHCVIPVTIYEAMLGAEIQVPTPTGKVAMKIQPLTQQGRTYRLKGLGLAGGDMHVVIDVIIPKRLTGEEVKLYRRLQQLCEEPNPRQEMFDKLANLH